MLLNVIFVKYIKPLLIILLFSFLLGIISLIGIYLYIKPNLPSVDVLKDVRLQTPMKIYTKDGKLISQYGIKKRVPLKLEQVPEEMLQALLATEDSRFYDHPGIDPIGVVRAFINLVVTGEKGQGASTLTMQLARNFFLTREKKYIRKIREVFLAWHIEQLMSKEEILELYINKIELGHRAFGFGAAAQVYYGKDVSELTLAEMATIAGLPQSPSILNPISRPDRSVQRRRIVLLRMLDEGYISQEEFELAANAPVTALKHGADIELHAPYLADLIYNEMIKLYGKEQAEAGGFQVYASVPSQLQVAAQHAVKDNLFAYDERHGYRGPIKKLWQPHTTVAHDEGALGKSSNKFDLPTTPPSKEQVLGELEQIEPIESLRPAVVLSIEKQSAQVLTKSGESLTLDWSGLSWARPYISDFKQGDIPTKAHQILSPGDVIWIRQRRDDSKWQLAQIPDVSGALIALDPQNGAAQAVVGGFSFDQSQFNRGTQAKRQIGSNIKPFIYSAALEKGYTLASIINDAPINKNEGDGKSWRPQNSPPVYDGPIRMRVALGLSKNVVSVRLLRAVGLKDTAEFLSRFGFAREDIPTDETISIGSSSHTPLEAAAAMSVIANGGFYVTPYFIDKINNDRGETLWQASPAVACSPCEQDQIEHPEIRDLEAMLAAELGRDLSTPSEDDTEQKILQAKRVLSPQNAYLVAQMMHSAVKPNGNWNKKTYWQGTGWRAHNILKRSDLHGKTGTTNDSRDTWFSGFTPNLVATAWVGFDDMSRQLGRTSKNPNLLNKSDENNWIGNAISGSEEGAKTAQPAWIRFMREALKNQPEIPMPIPENIITVRIDRNSGKLSKRSDHTVLFEYFRAQNAPTTYVQEDEFLDPMNEKQDTVQDVDDIF